MKTVLLIGTSHEYQLPQAGSRSRGSERFRGLVATTCQDEDVKAIAEEMSLDALELHSTKQSVGEQIAESFNIPHRYCDPSIKEQERLGIDQPDNIRMSGFFATCDQSKIEAKVNASLAARRDYWLEQLLNLDAWPVLFICGADHTEPFRTLLQANGIAVRVLFTKWAIT